ncbi:hypothetical protein CYY_001499 [Polysphondylium violaceum]|uniref:Protein kinase domain-containing protein n=1 Tax=Polysphondylium violaceum TaxID=133409 RepID=A0A8J4PY40_9MYCE|nr:hypothetical protein CYY_001499 [Polysphondylium violaceum]
MESQSTTKEIEEPLTPPIAYNDSDVSSPSTPSSPTSPKTPISTPPASPTPIATPRTKGKIAPNQEAFEESRLINKKFKIDKSNPKTPRTPRILRTPTKFNNNNNSKTINTTPTQSPLKTQLHFLSQKKRTKSCSNHFEYLHLIGEGCFGKVWKVQSNIDSKFYAIKKSKKPIWEPSSRSQQLQEIEKGMKLGLHPNIANILSAWEEGGHIYIQMELCERGSLYNTLSYLAKTDQKLSEEVIWKLLVDLCLGLQHVHSNEIIHLDIKPENLLFGNDGTLKICDFGVNFTDGDEEGDKIYMAPELLKNDPPTPAADIFSLGMTIYEMCTNYSMPESGVCWQNLRHGIIPFDDDQGTDPSAISLSKSNTSINLNNNNNNNLNSNQNTTGLVSTTTPVSEKMKNLIKRMMDPNPNTRITIAQILEMDDNLKSLLETANQKVLSYHSIFSLSAPELNVPFSSDFDFNAHLINNSNNNNSNNMFLPPNLQSSMPLFTSSPSFMHLPANLYSSPSFMVSGNGGSNSLSNSASSLLIESMPSSIPTGFVVSKSNNNNNKPMPITQPYIPTPPGSPLPSMTPRVSAKRKLFT